MSGSQCFCGGYFLPLLEESPRAWTCEAEDCPLITLGHGDWRYALIKLRVLEKSGQLLTIFPRFAIDDLAEYLAKTPAWIRNSYQVDKQKYPITERPTLGINGGMASTHCFCGGSFQFESPTVWACERADCPLVTLGYGDWRYALLKLREMEASGELLTRFPELAIGDLAEHVAMISAGNGQDGGTDKNMQSTGFLQAGQVELRVGM